MLIWEILGQGVLGFVATIGFGVLFDTPRQALLRSAGVGMLGYMLRYTIRSAGASTEVATFCGALTVGLVGYWQARHTHSPRLIFTVTGIIAMVPGIPAFETIVYFAKGDILTGLQSAIRATFLIGSIAAGLATARLLTEIDWLRSEN